MKKIILFCLLASSSVFSEEHDHKQFLLEAVKIGNQIQEQTKGKSLVDKISFIEGFAKEFSNNPIALDIIMQELSVEYSFAGSHRKALIARDKTAQIENSSFEDLTSYKEKDAVVEILERAKIHQIVMVNEAHDIAQHRVLTYRLLTGLWDQGYRYFAAEALSSSSSEQIDKGFITNQVGYYTREALYANLILKAKDLGFNIISYDQHKPAKLNTIDERETNAGLTIKEEIFDKDPDAKVVIHVGYSHINEEEWLASKLKSIINLETLTIDQTTRIERSSTKYEHPTFTKTVKSVELQGPFIYVKGNETWSSDSNKWDISVFWPRTRYLNGRPKWASLNRKTHDLASNECKNLYPCMVEVFKFNYTDEVPLDRIIISSKEELKTVFLSQGNNIIVTSDSNGNQIEKITVQN
ncbi:hypothetical protein TUM4438_34240 [Shewanella sairae]|uniref:Haem-binding uptake Tiki superfamily ChaN domain-containing protein n=1 Tax=Shewanella sairae TaxID=190310 RepID=A0ABQ4PN41_9GAMM|nr:hypothetical protein [Shewanella sairae]MCL1131946.1 hypothetical protein [Shewanella sairae]GIU49810.1 hypothetical protein TUM4438_34240 [Shewanella sairae]